MSVSLERPIRVRIFDQEYLIRSDEEEARVHEIANFVNDKFRKIKQDMEGLSEKKAAILVALDIANDYFHALRERPDTQSDIHRRIRALHYKIDAVTGEGKSP
jgi:cell division protein ZapA